jgi:hypothetical protein
MFAKHRELNFAYNHVFYLLDDRGVRGVLRLAIMLFLKLDDNPGNEVGSMTAFLAFSEANS